MTPRLVWLCAVAALCTLGCSGLSVSHRARAPDAPTQGLTKCKVAASNDSPLVTEWPASEKANLESLIREAGVVVAYSGCEMRLLPQCKVKGSYGWQRTTSATDKLDIRSQDELYAKLPLGAVSLEGELRNSGRLEMQTTVTGQQKLEGVNPAAPVAEGSCDGATHVLGALSVGAFKLQSGAALSANAGVDAHVASGGIGTQSSETVLRSSGNPASCRESTDEAPHPECRSPIQVFLWPLPAAQGKQGAVGTIPVSFADADNATVWQVIADGKAVCETPCERDVKQTARVVMREKTPRATSPDDEVDFPDLLKYQSAARIEARAEAAPDTAWVTAVALTAGGGAVWIGGIALILSQCARDDPDDPMGPSLKGPGCGVGLAMTPIGATAGLVGGIMLFFTGSAELDVIVIDDARLRLTPDGLGAVF